MKPFQKLQYQFAAHLRDPQRHKPPRGIEPRRLKIYTELFYNNVEGFLAAGFPVIRRITPDARWHALVRDFYARHESHEPLFHGIAAQFLEYLEHTRRAEDDPPFLRELAHYEWVELALSVAPEPARVEPVDPKGDLLDGVPVVSTLAWSLTYAFPVHRIGPDYQPEAAPERPTHVVVWRNADDDVRFMEANAVTARLLQLVKPARRSGREVLLRIAREMKHPRPPAVVEQGAATLTGLRERGIITGTKVTKRTKGRR